MNHWQVTQYCEKTLPKLSIKKQKFISKRYIEIIYTGNMKNERVSVTIFGGIIFRRNNQSSTLAGSAINCFNNVDKFLFVVNCPVDFVVVSSAQINHYVFVPIEKHHSAWIIQLVHLVEVGNLKVSNLSGRLVNEHIKSKVHTSVISTT